MVIGAPPHDETPARRLAAWTVERAPRRVRPAVELLASTLIDASEDRAVGLAAEIAFFSILSIPPLLLAIVAALGYLPGDQTDEFVRGLVGASSRVFTLNTVSEIIEPTLRAVVDRPRSDVVSIGFAVAVFSASRAVRVVLTAVSIAYDLEGQRPTWAQRLYGLVATIGLLVTVPLLLPLLLAGPGLGNRLVDAGTVPSLVGDLWALVYWLGVAMGAVLAVAGIYHVAAPWWTPFRRDLPGAVLAVGISVGVSAGLRSYTTRAVIGNEVFQLLAGPLVLLIWLYLIALGVILGAELNAELERMWPSPEQQRAPVTERLHKRLLSSSAATRVEALVPDAVRRRRESPAGRAHEEPRAGPQEDGPASGG